MKWGPGLLDISCAAPLGAVALARPPLRAAHAIVPADAGDDARPLADGMPDFDAQNMTIQYRRDSVVT